ncbi:MAG: hypothetical protein K1060chlam2_00098 [Chlamydiae bacterium]|nr:hypothetical protein [Chlamydiota bacterium]
MTIPGVVINHVLGSKIYAELKKKTGSDLNDDELIAQLFNETGKQFEVKGKSFNFKIEFSCNGNSIPSSVCFLINNGEKLLRKTEIIPSE